jgi:hypothetical protein
MVALQQSCLPAIAVLRALLRQTDGAFARTSTTANRSDKGATANDFPQAAANRLRQHHYVAVETFENKGSRPCCSEHRKSKWKS